MHRTSGWLLVAAAVLMPAALAQHEPGPTEVEVAIRFPPDYRTGQWVPFALCLLGPDAESGAHIQAALQRRGFAIATAADPLTAENLAELLASCRRQVRIDQGAVHAVVAALSDGARAALLANRHQFQTFTFCGGAAGLDIAPFEKLRRRRVQALMTDDADEIAAHCQRWHAARARNGPAAAVARTLDSLHDAAAVADGERYFAILPDDAVFLGTDPDERWTGKQFRGFAARYFERDSAWTYVPLERHITIAPGGRIAWFDEALDNKSYGECRGTGVLEKRGERWVLRLYDLTVPVPNELMADVARRIRAFQDAR